MKQQFRSEELSKGAYGNMDDLVLQEIRRQLDSKKVRQKAFIEITPRNDLSVNMKIRDLSGQEIFNDWVYSIKKVTQEQEFVCYIENDIRYFMTLEETLIF